MTKKLNPVRVCGLFKHFNEFRQCFPEICRMSTNCGQPWEGLFKSAANQIHNEKFLTHSTIVDYSIRRWVMCEVFHMLQPCVSLGLKKITPFKAEIKTLETNCFTLRKNKCTFRGQILFSRCRPRWSIMSLLCVFPASNPCLRMSCDFMCLLNPAGARCTCPEGKVLLNGTCNDVNISGRPVFYTSGSKYITF